MKENETKRNENHFFTLQIKRVMDSWVDKLYEFASSEEEHIDIG